MAEAKVEETKKEEVVKNPLEIQIEKLQQENAGLLKETLQKKEQIRELESKKATEEADRLKEQNKFKELYEGTLPKAKRLEEIEPVLTSLMDQEISDIPEDRRDLIPNFDKPEQRLLWVRQAKSKGLFTKAAEVDPKTGKPKAQILPTVQSKVNTDGTLPEFVSWPANDSRLTGLSLAEFQTWKRHNQKAVQGVTGWGNTR